jgi:hypothetical protein
MSAAARLRNSPPMEKLDEPRESRKLADEILPIMQWSPLWIGMWIVIAVGLLTSVFFMGIWHWLTLTLFAFGVPEFVGTLKHDGRYPFGFTGAIGAYWFHVPSTQHGLVGRAHRVAVGSLRSSIRAIRCQEVGGEEPRLRISAARSRVGGGI